MTPQPPHNLQAEQALLGAILFDNETLSRITDRLRDSHFYDPVHGRVFAVASRLIAQGRLADAVTLREHFIRDGGLAEIGGAAYLLTLLESAARLSVHAQDYAERILDLAMRRRIIALAHEAEELALAPPEGADASDIVEELERSLGLLDVSGEGGDVSLRDAARGVVEALSETRARGLATGLARLDEKLGGLHAPDLIIIAGRPGMGKTSLATNIAVNVASSDVVTPEGEIIRPRTVAFFSLEMSAEQLAARALARRSRAPGRKAFDYGDVRIEGRRPQARDVAPLVADLPASLRIVDKGVQTLASVRASCRAIKRNEGALDLIVVDYLQLMDDPTGRKDGRVQEVTAITKGLKALAKDLNVPVIALSQLSRQVEQRQDKTPQNSDLRESGSIEQDADTIIFAYREHYYLMQAQPVARDDEDRGAFLLREAQWQERVRDALHKFRAIIGKQRMGPVGVVDLYCDLAPDIIADNPPPPPHQPHWQDR